MDDKTHGNDQTSRREAIKRISIVVGGVATMAVLPSKWTKPIMDVVVGPAAADFISYCDPDGTNHRSFGTRAPGAFGNQCPPVTTTLGPS